MHLKLFFSFLILLFLRKCSNPTQPQTFDEITNIEYVILNATIDSLYYSPNNSIILKDSTTTGIYSHNPDSTLTYTLDYIQQHISILEIETIQNFKLKNLSKTNIAKPLNIHSACVLASTIHETYPYIEVSRVGVNTSGNQALVYVGRIDAPKGGTGLYHIPKKDNERWVIIGSVEVWIS